MDFLATFLKNQHITPSEKSHQWMKTIKNLSMTDLVLSKTDMGLSIHDPEFAQDLANIQWVSISKIIWIFNT